MKLWANTISQELCLGDTLCLKASRFGISQQTWQNDIKKKNSMMAQTYVKNSEAYLMLFHPWSIKTNTDWGVSAHKATAAMYMW